MRIRKTATILSFSALGAAAGATALPPSAPPDEAAAVHARVETETVGKSLGDEADDIAIWVDQADPSKSLIVGTDKKNGLFIYGMDGRILAHANSGRFNNIDLRGNVMLSGRPVTIVAASDANDRAANIALFILDTAKPALVPLGRVPGGSQRAYGLCLYQHDGKLWAFNVFRNGEIVQVAIDFPDGKAHAQSVRTMKLKGNAEGCVADDRTGNFYAAERDVGIWRWNADPAGGAKPAMVAPVDGTRLVADVEGLAIAEYGKVGGYLVASSQGSDTFVAYRLPDNSYAGRFRVMPQNLDGTSHTDGIEIVTADMGTSFPGGLFVAQDNDNRPEPQNFKLVAWGDVMGALRLPPQVSEDR